MERGTVATYGAADLGAAYELMTALSELHPKLNFVGEFGNTVLEAAMVTKRRRKRSSASARWARRPCAWWPARRTF